LRNPIELVTRYMKVWNEPSPEVRRAAVRELWTEDGVHILQPPEEAVKIASRPGIGLTATFQARGHEELTARVDSAHNEFVATGQMVFRLGGDVVQLHDMVRFGWEAVSDGEVVAGGSNVLLLDADGRIRVDYQFVE
jgi:2-hydroxychromene-2-carboxylate isomerase